MRFVGLVLAGDTVEARVDVADDGTAMFEVEEHDRRATPPSSGRTACAEPRQPRLIARGTGGCYEQRARSAARTLSGISIDVLAPGCTDDVGDRAPRTPAGPRPMRGSAGRTTWCPRRAGATSTSTQSSKRAGPDHSSTARTSITSNSVDPEVGTEAERLHEARARLVEVREPVRVEHDALAVDLGVADADAMRERCRAQPAQELGAVLGPATTASMHAWRSAPTSSSVSVRSGARNRSANARLTLPAPSASERNTSKSATCSSSSPAARSERRLHVAPRERCRRRRTRGRSSTPGTATPAAARRSSRGSCEQQHRRRARTRRPEPTSAERVDDAGSRPRPMTAGGLPVDQHVRRRGPGGARRWSRLEP